MPEASKAGVGHKGDRAQFPGVTTSMAPTAELFMAHNCQCVGEQKPCLSSCKGWQEERKKTWIEST